MQSQHPNGELKEYKCHLCPRFVLPTSRKLKNHIKKHHGTPEEKPDQSAEINLEAEKGGDPVKKQETYKKRKRKTKNTDKIAVGVMNKAYDCKLCEASFVCQDSLLTHQRYHNRILDEVRKVERNEGIVEYSRAGDKRGDLHEPEKKMENFGSSDLGLSEAVDSFSDSLRNAEILASLNSAQGIGSIRQYVMITPETVKSVYNTEEYAAVQN